MDLYVPDAPDYFLTTFGLPRRDIICERSKSPTLGQALHMINGDTLLKKVESKDNILTRYLDESWSDDRIIDAIYQSAFARLPSPRDRAAVKEFIAAEQAAGRSRRKALEGVLWTVLNSEEFQVNH